MRRYVSKDSTPLKMLKEEIIIQEIPEVCVPDTLTGRDDFSFFKNKPAF